MARKRRAPVVLSCVANIILSVFSLFVCLLFVFVFFSVCAAASWPRPPCLVQQMQRRPKRPMGSGEALDANLPFSNLNEAYQAAGTMSRVNINRAV